MDTNLDGWRLATHLSVVDIAILLAGGDPSTTDMEPSGYNQYEPIKRTAGHPGYDGYFSAIVSAVRNGVLTANLAYPARAGAGFKQNSPNAVVTIDAGQIVQSLGYDVMLPPGDGFSEAWADKLVVEREPDWNRTTIEVSALKSWLLGRGITSGFFSKGNVTALEDFMDSKHDCFSAELACAVAAWKALSPQPIRSQTPKAAIRKWLDSKAAAYCGGEVLSKSAKERIITLVNWRKSGGAPITGR